MSDNLAIFVGNVGQDSQCKEVGKDNNLVLNFSLAVKTGYGKREETLWVQCAIWGDRAEKLEQYITKGVKLVVKGEVTPEAYENKDDEIIAQLRCNVSDFSFGGGGEEGNKGGGGGRRRSSGDDDSGGGRGRSSGRSRSGGRSSRSSSRSSRGNDDNDREPENEGMEGRDGDPAGYEDQDDIPFD